MVNLDHVRWWISLHHVRWWIGLDHVRRWISLDHVRENRNRSEGESGRTKLEGETGHVRGESAPRQKVNLNHVTGWICKGVNLWISKGEFGSCQRVNLDHMSEGGSGSCHSVNGPCYRMILHHVTRWMSVSLKNLTYSIEKLWNQNNCAMWLIKILCKPWSWSVTSLNSWHVLGWAILCKSRSWSATLVTRTPHHPPTPKKSASYCKMKMNYIRPVISLRGFFANISERLGGKLLCGHKTPQKKGTVLSSISILSQNVHVKRKLTGGPMDWKTCSEVVNTDYWKSEISSPGPICMMSK